MSQWDEQTGEIRDVPALRTQAESQREKVVLMLVSAIEMAETAYVMGGIDHDEYAKELQEVDAKLGIVGLTLAIKPWKQAGSRV